jgi:predicted RNase H-like HicB family nuclease
MKRAVSLPVFIIKEGKYFVAYTPALDFAATGNSIESAKKSFSEAINIFLDEIEEKGTLEEVLQEFGWQKIENTLQPPEVVSQTKEIIKIPPFA